jgi:hypothetical protein
MLGRAPSRPVTAAHPHRATHPDLVDDAVEIPKGEERARRAPAKSAPGARRRSRARGVAGRWWILPVALGLGGLAFYVLVEQGSVGSMSVGPAPMERIGAPSREALERAIDEAHRSDGSPR